MQPQTESYMSPLEAVRSLLDLNWSQAKIATEAITTQATISKIKLDGRVPNYDLGVRLVNLAKKQSHKRVSRGEK